MAGLVTLILLPAFRKKGRRLQEFSELMAELYPCFPNDCLPPEIQLLLCFFAFPSESQTHAGLLQTEEARSIITQNFQVSNPRRTSTDTRNLMQVLLVQQVIGNVGFLQAQGISCKAFSLIREILSLFDEIQ